MRTSMMLIAIVFLSSCNCICSCGDKCGQEKNGQIRYQHTGGIANVELYCVCLKSRGSEFCSYFATKANQNSVQVIGPDGLPMVCEIPACVEKE
jgi:hypothetical protein